MGSALIHTLSPQMKMADLVNLDFTLVGVLSRMGIPFGFGDSTVEEVCQRYGVHTDTFLLICSVYAFAGYRPPKEALKKASLGDVVSYLHRSHDYYINVALEQLADSLRQLMAPCEERQQKILVRFFEDYKQELLKHFAYEEAAVFPHVDAFLEGDDSDDFTIGDYEDNHSDIHGKIVDLKNLVLKHLPLQCNQQQIFRSLFYIFSLEHDLEKHTILEEEMLADIHKLRTGHSRSREDDKSSSEELSEREKEILVAVASGMLNKEIAYRYDISIHTVISHRKNITRKTGIKTVAGLTVYALLNNLIDADTFVL